MKGYIYLESLLHNLYPSLLEFRLNNLIVATEISSQKLTKEFVYNVFLPLISDLFTDNCVNYSSTYKDKDKNAICHMIQQGLYKIKTTP